MTLFVPKLLAGLGTLLLLLPLPLLPLLPLPLPPLLRTGVEPYRVSNAMVLSLGDTVCVLGVAMLCGGAGCG